MANASENNSLLRILIDVHVILEILEKKTPHFTTSSELMSKILTREIQGVLPGYAIVTIYNKLIGEAATQQSNDIVDWFLANFDIAPLDKELLVSARGSEMENFSEALLISSALRSNCKMIISRSPEQFGESPLPVYTPEELLYRLSVPDEE